MAGAQTLPDPSLSRGGSLIVFFLAAFALMWVCFFTVVWAGIPVDSPLRSFLLLLGTFSPALSALWLTARVEGSNGVQELLGRIFRGQVGWQYYLFAAGYIAAIKLAVALIYRVSTGAWPRFGTEAWYVMLAAVVISTPVQSGEEVGWRGYALPRLAARFGLTGASLILGVIWAVWHIPQFFIPQADTYGQSFPIFAIQVTAISVAMAWLYARTRGSLLLTMLLHAAVNNTKDIVPSTLPGGTDSLTLKASPIAWLTMALLWACAVYFLVDMRKLPIASLQSPQ